MSVPACFTMYGGRDSFGFAAPFSPDSPGLAAFRAALGEAPGCGELSGVGVGRNFGRNVLNRGSNFLASSAEENSIANNTLGSFGRVGKAATIIREVISASDSELSHFIKVLTFCGGPATRRIGSMMSVKDGERSN